MVNVTIYSIHGSYGIGKRKWKPGLLLEESDLPNKNIWKNGVSWGYALKPLVTIALVRPTGYDNRHLFIPSWKNVSIRLLGVIYGDICIYIYIYMHTYAYIYV